MLVRMPVSHVVLHLVLTGRTFCQFMAANRYTWQQCYFHCSNVIFIVAVLFSLQSPSDFKSRYFLFSGRQFQLQHFEVSCRYFVIKLVLVMTNMIKFFIASYFKNHN